jgi:chorismate mutase
MTITCAPADTLLSIVVRRLAIAETVAAAKWSSGRLLTGAPQTRSTCAHSSSEVRAWTQTCT